MAIEKRDPTLDARPEMGFHGLKECLTTTRFLSEHCEFLARHLRDIAWATRGAAFLARRSVKKRRYLDLPRKPKIEVSHLEAKYERAMYQRWSTADGDYECAWHRILDYQVPVSDRRPSLLGLKAIDLLAVSKMGLPVIIELKIARGKQAETPLRALLEAASYACVFQVDWPQFRTEVECKNASLGISGLLPEDLKEVHLIVAGPPDYWDYWNLAKRSNFIEAKPVFRSLVDTFKQEGFPITFVSVNGPVQTPAALTARKERFLEE